MAQEEEKDVLAVANNSRRDVADSSISLSQRLVNWIGTVQPTAAVGNGAFPSTESGERGGANQGRDCRSNNPNPETYVAIQM